MKKLVLAALAATALSSAPAMAQVSGTVVISGTVASKCIVTNIGATANPDFGGTVALGDLAATDGTLATTLAGTFNGTTGGNLAYRVVCTSPGTTVSVQANPLTTGAVATAGYANRVDYTANVALSLVGSSPTLSDSSVGVASPTAQTYAARLATGATNIAVTASTFSTPGGAADVLVAGTYGGSIAITVTPAA